MQHDYYAERGRLDHCELHLYVPEQQVVRRRRTRDYDPRVVREKLVRLVRTPLLAAAACGGVLAGPTAAFGTRRGGCAAASKRVAADAAFARGRYRLEADGDAVHAALGLVTADPSLARALRAGDLAAARAAALRLVLGHKHVTAIRVRRGSRVLVETRRYPFDVAGSRADIRGLGTVDVTIQDVIGFIRLVHKFTGADVVVRAAGGEARSSTAAERAVRLPASGCATVGGRTYAARSFAETDFAGQALRIWVLRRA